MATGEIVEQVAEGFEEAAKVTRRLDVKPIVFGLGGLGVGLAVGFFFGYRWNKEQIRAEAFKQSAQEVEAIREFYQEKSESVKVIPTVKPELEDVVEERGYAQTEINVTPERPLPPPVPVREPPVLPRRDFTTRGIAKRHVDREKDKNDGWDYAAEIAQRSNDHPYVIHQDEYSQNEAEYNQVTYTYYAADAVLTDEDESVVTNQDEMVGLDNLGKFGHGADDFHVLYVRNDRLELDFEICLLGASYGETVQGLSGDGEN